MTPDDFINHLKNTRSFVNDPASDKNDVALLEHAMALRFHELCHDMRYHITPRDRFDFCIETLCAADTFQKSTLSTAMLHEVLVVARDASKTDDVELAVDCNNLVLNSFDTYHEESRRAARRNYLLCDFLQPHDIKRRFLTLSYLIGCKPYNMDADLCADWINLTHDDLGPFDLLNGFDIALRGAEANPAILNTVRNHAADVILNSPDDGDTTTSSGALINSLALFAAQDTRTSRFWAGWLAQRTLNTQKMPDADDTLRGMRGINSKEYRRAYFTAEAARKQGDVLWRCFAARRYMKHDDDLKDTYAASADKLSGSITHPKAHAIFTSFITGYHAHIGPERGDMRAIHDILFTGIYAAMATPQKCDDDNPLHAAYRRIGLHAHVIQNLDALGHTNRYLRHYAANRRDMLVRVCVPALKDAEATNRPAQWATLGATLGAAPGARRVGYNTLPRVFDLN